MKKVILSLTLVASVLGAYAQGTVSFKNDNTFTTAAVQAGNGHTDRLVYNTDNTTLLSGTNWSAQLYYATTSGAAEGSLVAVDASPRAFRVAGATDGVWSGATKTLPGTTAGINQVVTLQVRVWDGSISSTFGGPVTGKSATFNYTVPAAGSLPSAFYMEGLQSFTLQAAPEPTTIALGVLGAAGLLIARRRK